MTDSAITDFDEALIAASPSKLHAVDAVLQGLPDVQRRKVLKALRDSSYGAGRLSKALGLMGHKVGEASVRSWRDKNVPA